MPDIENSRKTAEKNGFRVKCRENSREEWVPCKVPRKQPRNSRKPAGTAEKQLFCLFWLFFGCFSRRFICSPLSSFLAVLRLFSMSGIRHLSRWPQRLQIHWMFLWRNGISLSLCFRRARCDPLRSAWHWQDPACQSSRQTRPLQPSSGWSEASLSRSARILRAHQLGADRE